MEDRLDLILRLTMPIIGLACVFLAWGLARASKAKDELQAEVKQLQDKMEAWATVQAQAYVRTTDWRDALARLEKNITEIFGLLRETVTKDDLDRLITTMKRNAGGL